METTESIVAKYNITFWLHLFVTLLAWAVPFLFPWPWVLAAYAAVVLQFTVFKRCLMNKTHALDDTDNDHTFYAYLLEQHLGLRLPRVKVKRFVRFWKYLLLSGFTLFWQLGLKKTPLFTNFELPF